MFFYVNLIGLARIKVFNFGTIFLISTNNLFWPVELFIYVGSNEGKLDNDSNLWRVSLELFLLETWVLCFWNSIETVKFYEGIGTKFSLCYQIRALLCIKLARWFILLKLHCKPFCFNDRGHGLIAMLQKLLHMLHIKNPVAVLRVEVHHS